VEGDIWVGLGLNLGDVLQETGAERRRHGGMKILNRSSLGGYFVWQPRLVSMVGQSSRLSCMLRVGKSKFVHSTMALDDMSEKLLEGTRLTRKGASGVNL
jgi:hypothetical protein